MFTYDNLEIPVCEIDAQTEFSEKTSKTSFKTLGSFGKIQEDSMDPSRGFCMKDLGEKWAVILPSPSQ